MDQPTLKRNPWKRAGRIVLKTVLFILLFFVIVVLLIQTPPVQSFVRKKAVSWLENKLDTRVEVGRVYIGLPKNVILEDIYVEDRQKDTLLSGGKVKANINILRLIFNNEVDFKSIELEDVTARIKRQLPDTTFNFQFIVDAFAPSSPSTTPADTSSSSPIFLRSVELNRIRLVYQDIVSGSDMEAWLEHLDTKMDTFDPERMHFVVPETNIKGLNARIYQVKPLARPEPVAKDMAEATDSSPFNLDFNSLNLENIKLDYRNDVSAMYANVDLGNLQVKPGDIDFTNKRILLEQLALENTTAAIRLGNKEQAKIVEEEIEKEVETRVEAGWRFEVAELSLKNNNIAFDNDNSRPVTNGMDYAHLNATNFNLGVKDFIFTLDSIAGNIGNASFNEKSGFVLNQLQTEFVYSPIGAALRGLYLETPGTELKRSAEIKYASLEALQNDIGNLVVDLDLEESKLLVKDLLTFVPDLRSQPAFANPNTTWYLDSRITGRLSDLTIANLNVSGLRDTRIDLSGKLGGLPDMNALAGDLRIRNITSSRRDVEIFVPRNTIPQNINFPETFSMNGSIKGNPAALNTDLTVITSLGNANVNGSFSRLADPDNIKYGAVVRTTSLNLASLLRNNGLPTKISSTISAEGSGLNPKTASANFDGTVHSAAYNNYLYTDLKVNGSIANQDAKLKASMVDPNIHFNINADANFSSEYPSVSIDGMIDSIKLQNLNLSPDNMIFRGQVDGDFANTDPDALDGKLDLIQTLLVVNDQRLQLDTVRLIAGGSDTGRFVRLNSDVVNAELAGKYQLSELGSIFQNAIQPYFAVAGSQQNIVVAPYDFTMNAYILDNPALRVFLPDLKRVDSVKLESRFSNEKWNATLDAPAIDLGPNELRDLHLVAGTGQDAIDVNASIASIRSGKNLKLDNTTLNAKLANNTIDFGLNIKDPGQRDKYNINGLFTQPQSGTYVLSLQPDSLILNYDAWTVSPQNKIAISNGGINASDLVLQQGNQQLRLNSLSASTSAPLDVTFNDFQLETLTGFIQTDSTLAQGTMNGKITFTDLTTAPAFTGDLSVNNLTIRTDTVGDVRILANNQTQNTYFADVTLSGRGNDVKLTGNYHVQAAGTSTFDMDLNIRTMQLSSAQAFTGGAIRESTGTLSGRFDVRGTFDRPVINGDLNFNKTRFNMAMLNSYFHIDGEKLRVDAQGVHFDKFQIRDSAQNALVIDGIAATSNFSNYNFDLSLRARNFKMLSSTKKDNDLFYGQLYFNTDLEVGGTEVLPEIQGRLVVNENTRMTVVLPQREPGVVEREGVIEFVDFNAPLNDSLFLAAYDSLNVSQLRGMDVNVNVEIQPEAEFNLIVDEGNGDFLNVRGEANLNAGIDPSGKVTLTGAYELEEGAYELSFNFLRRRFEIEKGSRIVWEGEPTSATVDLRAKYISNAAPLDLVKNQIGDAEGAARNIYLQKLPFEVFLSMQGELMKPVISFDIVLPEENYVVGNDVVTNVRTRLDQLRQEEGEMNKQVFSLLLLNRFVAENPFNSSTSGPTVGTLARQSVSKLLTEQLNRLADDLIAGVDLEFDVLSSEDYTSGKRADRTDLNVGLSKRLLNDRLKISIGSNFELEGPSNSNYSGSNIAGNVAIDYQLSRDNRYVLRAYRKNEYEGVIDGYLIETGVGFIITLDYNRFSQIFQRRRPRARNQENNQNQQPTQQPATTPTPVKEPENK